MVLNQLSFKNIGWGAAYSCALLILVQVFAQIWATDVLAHRLPHVFSEMTWRVSADGQGGTLQVVHRVHAHDAEEGLSIVRGEGHLLLVDLETQAKLALYIEKTFTVTDGSGQPITFNLLGADTDGDYAYIYQEVMLDALPSTLHIDARSFRDVIPDQSNQVNLDTGDQVLSLYFAGEDGIKTLRPGGGE